MAVLADLAEAASEALGGPTYVGYAAKEILHYDILAAMRRAGFLDRLAFHGGTALRLCCGAERLSEDLDFSEVLRLPISQMPVCGKRRNSP